MIKIIVIFLKIHQLLTCQGIPPKMSKSPKSIQLPKSAYSMVPNKSASEIDPTASWVKAKGMTNH